MSDDTSLKFIEFNGHKRKLSCLPPRPTHGLPFFSKFQPSLPREEWLPIDNRFFGIPTWDQQETNACVGYAATKAVQYAIKKQRGEMVKLNPHFVYAIINGGEDEGAIISDAMRALINFGACEELTIPWEVTYKKRLLPKDYKSASRFKMAMAYHCRNYSEICEALTKGFFVPIGIYVGDNFPNIDSDGICPLPKGEAGGHAMLAVGLAFHKRRGWIILVHNSWGNEFGMNGFCYLHEGHFDRRTDAFFMTTLS